MQLAFRGSSNSWEGRAGDRLWITGNYLFAVLLALMRLPFFADPLGPNRLDDSWRVDNYLAVLNHATFGTRYVWIYGPLGFADFPKLVSQHLLAVAVVLQVAFAIVLAALLVHILTFYLRVHRAAATLIIIGLLLPWNVTVGSIEFMAFLCVLLLLYVALVEREDSLPKSADLSVSSRVLVAIAGSLIAVAPLVKVSLIPAAVGTAAFWALQAVGNRSWRALTLFLLPAVLVWFGVFALAGGGIASGFKLPTAVLPLATGYTAAMSVRGNFYYPIALEIVAVLTAVCVVNVFLHRNGNWWFVGSVVLLWLAAFKEGFVRQDGHVYSFFSVAPWCLFLLWCAFRPLGAVRGNDDRVQPENVPRAASISAVVACALCFFILVSEISTVVRPVSELQGRVSGFVKAVRFATSEDYARAEMSGQEQSGLEQRAALGLAPLAPILRDRRVFAWPWDGNAIVAAHAVQTFPPVPQEYAAYTTALDELDARFFSSAGRPPLGLVSVEAIDGRLPLQTAGMSFLQLLSCYQPIALSGAFLVVTSAPERAGCPRDLSAGTPITTWQPAQLGEWLRIPSKPGHITIAQVDVRPSTRGTLMNLGFGSAPLRLSMRMPGGKIEAFRMVHNTLRDGVMVSTVLSDASDLAGLWLGLPKNDVEAIAWVAGRPQEWRSVFTIRFLEIPMLDTEARVVRVIRSSVAQGQGTKRELRGGHIDSVRPAGDGRGADWLWIDGWYVADPAQALDPNLQLAFLEGTGKAFLVRSYSVPRIDVVRVLGSGTPLLCGFTALVPRGQWDPARSLAVLRSDNGSYRIVGVIRQ